MRHDFSARGVAFAVFAAMGGASLACAQQSQVVLDVAPHWRAMDGQRGRALHVAMPMPFEGSVAELARKAVQADGASVWTLELESPGAIFMSAKFSRFIVPAGVTVGFVAKENVYVAGPFTSSHVTETGRFGSPMVPGDVLTIEVVVPAGAPDPELVLESVSHGFREVLGMGDFFGDGSGDVAPSENGPFRCQRDIVCPEGEPYLHLKDAAAEGYDGAYVCSGQLINNARQDGRYLYITAAHCEWWKDPSTMTYYWDYANETCGGNDFPSLTFSTGSTDLYHSTIYDFDVNLLELDGDLETEFDVYFAGWNRGATPPASSVAISHPADKPLQIAIDEDPTLDCTIPSNCPNGWGPWYWRITDYEVGVTEGGSSGGALYDQDQSLVGVLTGGVGTNCDNFGWDEYFKLSTEWDKLQPYLDPDDTGVMTVPGWNGSTANCPGDFNDDGTLNIFDFIAFQGAFGGMDTSADCNGDRLLNVLDFVCFQAAFAAGCP